MLHIFNWPAESEKPPRLSSRPPERPPERPRRFEAQLVRSYAEMRARRQSA